MRRQIFFTFIGLMAILFGIAGCKEDSSNPYGGTTSPPPSTPPANTVSMAGMAFSPATLTIQHGATVTWQNSDGYPHTSTSDSAGVWDTGSIPGGYSNATTFSTPGTFPYHCTYHRAMGMTGKIIVQ